MLWRLWLSMTFKNFNHFYFYMILYEFTNLLSMRSKVCNFPCKAKSTPHYPWICAKWDLLLYIFHISLQFSTWSEVHSTSSLSQRKTKSTSVRFYIGLQLSTWSEVHFTPSLSQREMRSILYSSTWICIILKNNVQKLDIIHENFFI